MLLLWATNIWGKCEHFITAFALLCFLTESFRRTILHVNISALFLNLCSPLFNHVGILVSIRFWSLLWSIKTFFVVQIWLQVIRYQSGHCWPQWTSLLSRHSHEDKLSFYYQEIMKHSVFRIICRYLGSTLGGIVGSLGYLEEYFEPYCEKFRVTGVHLEVACRLRALWGTLESSAKWVF